MSIPPARRRASGRATLLVLGCGAAAALSPGSALAIGVWLLPAVLLWIGERTRGRPVARVLILAGAAGALPGMAQLWRDGASLHEAAAMAVEPMGLAHAWAAQAAAWLLGHALCVILAAIAELAARHRRAHLQATRAKLLLAWPPPEALS